MLFTFLVFMKVCTFSLLFIKSSYIPLRELFSQFHLESLQQLIFYDIALAISLSAKFAKNF